MTFRTVFLLPPLPRLRDWWLAGACAGLLLGLAEFAVAFVDGSVFSTSLVMVLLATNAVLVSLLSGTLGMLLRVGRLRPSYSQLVGAVLGPLGMAVLARPAWAWMAIGEMPADADLVQLGVGAVAISLTAVGAARIGERVERTGAPASAPLVWGCAAILLAYTSRLAEGGSLYTPLNISLLAGGILLAAIAWLLLVVIARHRETRPRPSFARILTATTVAAVALCYAPSAYPWLLYDQDLADVAEGPPNILVATLATSDAVKIPGTGRLGAGAEAPHLGLLAWHGVAYPRLSQDWISGAAATLSLPDGTTLPERLEFSGYAVGAIHRSPESAQDLDLGIDNVDDRRGAARALRENGGWMSAAPLLLGPGSAALEAMGLDRAYRSTEEVATRAMTWLLNWRTRRSANPFFLLVDLRLTEGRQDLAQADAAFASILEQLHLLEADTNTLVLVTLEGDISIAGRRKLAAVIRPPPSWLLPGVGTRADNNTRARDIAIALQQITESDGTKPMPLPGIPFDYGEEEPELPTFESDLDRWLDANPLPTLPRLSG